MKAEKLSVRVSTEPLLRLAWLCKESGSGIMFPQGVSVRSRRASELWWLSSLEFEVSTLIRAGLLVVIVLVDLTNC